MRVISVYIFNKNHINQEATEEILNKLNSLRSEEWWIKANYNRYWKEISGTLNYYVAIDEILEKFVPEALKYFKNDEKKRIRKQLKFFIDLEKKIVEIYRGKDRITEFLKSALERVLKTKLEPMSLTPEQLLKIVKNHSTELTQAYFSNVNGFLYEVYRGRHLETNLSFLIKLRKQMNSLRIISIKPRILYESLYPYQITVNGNKGTIRFSNGNGKEKPRSEIRQIIYIISNVMGR